MTDIEEMGLKAKRAGGATPEVDADNNTDI